MSSIPVRDTFIFDLTLRMPLSPICLAITCTEKRHKMDIFVLILYVINCMLPKSDYMYNTQIISMIGTIQIKEVQKH